MSLFPRFSSSVALNGANAYTLLRNRHITAGSLSMSHVRNMWGTCSFSTEPNTKDSVVEKKESRASVPSYDSFVDGKPTIEYAKKMRLAHHNLSNTDIIHLSSEGCREARKEILIRNIMAVDSIPYDDALNTFKKIERENHQLMTFHKVPYLIGISAAVTAGLFAVPMVFDYNTVLWFNEKYVTADIPEPKDLETFLEVGSFSWNWMEPVLGQISFFLLTLQFGRAQLINLGLRPYGSFVKNHRANKLMKRYPQYDARLLRDYVNVISYYTN